MMQLSCSDNSFTFLSPWNQESCPRNWIWGKKKGPRMIFCQETEEIRKLWDNSFKIQNLKDFQMCDLLLGFSWWVSEEDDVWVCEAAATVRPEVSAGISPLPTNFKFLWTMLIVRSHPMAQWQMWCGERGFRDSWMWTNSKIFVIDTNDSSVMFTSSFFFFSVYFLFFSLYMEEAHLGINFEWTP